MSAVLPPRTQSPLCPYCDVRAVLRLHAGRPIRWECPVIGCDARVGFHSQSAYFTPVGTMARGDLRRAREEAHLAFDDLWNGKLAQPRFSSRKLAYSWLAQAMAIRSHGCHFALFDEVACAVAADLIRRLQAAPR